MKIKKIMSILAVTMCLTFGVTSLTPTFEAQATIIDKDVTNDKDVAKQIQKSSEIIDKDSRVNWTGKISLTSTWKNVTTSNNLFSDEPLVENHAGNPGKIRVRILNSYGYVVGSEKDISVGNLVRLDKIPAFSGKYTLQARALEKDGVYTITID